MMVGVWVGEWRKSEGRLQLVEFGKGGAEHDDDDDDGGEGRGGYHKEGGRGSQWRRMAVGEWKRDFFSLMGLGPVVEDIGG